MPACLDTSNSERQRDPDSTFGASATEQRKIQAVDIIGTR